jgi:hypothetical protein
MLHLCYECLLQSGLEALSAQATTTKGTPIDWRVCHEIRQLRQFSAQPKFSRFMDSSQYAWFYAKMPAILEQTAGMKREKFEQRAGTVQQAFTVRTILLMAPTDLF